MVFWLAPPEQRYWQNRETANIWLVSSVGRALVRQSGGRRFKSCSSQFFFVHPKICWLLPSPPSWELLLKFQLRSDTSAIIMNFTYNCTSTFYNTIMCPFTYWKHIVPFSFFPYYNNQLPCNLVSHAAMFWTATLSLRDKWTWWQSTAYRCVLLSFKSIAESWWSGEWGIRTHRTGEWSRRLLSPKGFLIGGYCYLHQENMVSIRIKLSPNWDSIVDIEGFPIGAYWYPHWENRVLIGIGVSSNWDSIVDIEGFPIGAFWYPHWENRVLIGIGVSSNWDSIVDIDPVSHR